MSRLNAPAFLQNDAEAMALAMHWAEAAVGLSDPNPRVGCVLLDAERRVLGLGHTQAAGGPHAEVMALRHAQQEGRAVRGASAFVTLEPCAHHGRTPPCCDALIDAGVSRVVIAIEDPNPLVAGQGVARLRAAGIRVDIGLMAEPAAELNIGFLHRMRTGLPYVRMKWASSLDGRVAHLDGHSRWITGEPARRDGQSWRRRAAAVLTGIGTVLADDPRLDVREFATARQPLRVVLDTQLRLPPEARLLAPPGEVLLIHGESTRASALPAQHWACTQDPSGRLELVAVMAELGRRGINELHVEAGSRLNGSFLLAGLVDELLVYLAPRLVGPGLSVVELGASLPLNEAQRWHWKEFTKIGDDLRLRLGRPGALASGPRVAT